MRREGDDEERYKTHPYTNSLRAMGAGSRTFFAQVMRTINLDI